MLLCKAKGLAVYRAIGLVTLVKKKATRLVLYPTALDKSMQPTF